MSFVESYDKYEKEKVIHGDIPEKYKELLSTVLNQMESETGNMYQFTVNKFGNPSNYNCIIGNFKNRNIKIEVYDTKPKYKELVDVYDSRVDLVNKIKNLRCNEIFEETKEISDNMGGTITIGKCKNCHSYCENIPYRYPNTITSSCCQNDECPKKILFSKWDDIYVSEWDGHIFQSSGGSLSICHDIGKYKFI